MSTSKLQEDPDTILETVEDLVCDVNNRSHDKCKWNKTDFKSNTSAGFEFIKKIQAYNIFYYTIICTVYF